MHSCLEGLTNRNYSCEEYWRKNLPMEFLAKKDNGLIQHNHSRIDFRPIVFLAKRLKIRFSLSAQFRSILKVNEFTLAGAAWPNPLAWVGQKERRGADSLLALKRDIFKRIQYTRSMLPRDCFAPHGLAMTQQTFPSRYNLPRVQYPLCFHRWLRVIVLFFVYEIVEVSSREQEQNSASLLLSCTISSFFEYKKGVELSASIYLRPSTALHK